MMLRTDRLSMVPLSLGDVDFALELFSRPALLAHRADPRPESRRQVTDRLETEAAHWREFGFGRWRIDLGGRPIGFGGLMRGDFGGLAHSDVGPGLNLSYHLDPTYWGRGYATEFGKKAIEVAFDELGAEQVSVLIRPSNAASRRMALRLGFRFAREIDLHGAPTGLFVQRAPGAEA